MTPKAPRLDLRSIMAQYVDAKDEWDQAELWEHIPGLVARIREMEATIDRVEKLICEWREQSNAVAEYNVAQLVASCANTLQSTLEPHLVPPADVDAHHRETEATS